MSFINVIDGERVHPFGKKPQGYFTYTQSGRLAIQIQSETLPDSWSLNTSSDDEGRSGGAPW